MTYNALFPNTAVGFHPYDTCFPYQECLYPTYGAVFNMTEVEENRNETLKKSETLPLPKRPAHSFTPQEIQVRCDLFFNISRFNATEHELKLNLAETVAEAVADAVAETETVAESEPAAEDGSAGSDARLLQDSSEENVGEDTPAGEDTSAGDNTGTGTDGTGTDGTGTGTGTDGKNAT